MQYRTLPLITTLAVAASGAVLAGSAVAAPSPSAGTTAAAAPTTPTPFAMQAFGYGSRVKGGEVPTGSDRSAFQVIGCTNLAGLDKHNSEAELHPEGGDLTLSGVRTHVWTDKTGARVSSWASHDIDKVTLADTATSDLYLRGVSSTSHSWHSKSGFHAKTTADVGRIVLDSGGVRTTYPVPAPGDSVNIPGVATVSVGDGTVTEGQHGASALVDAVRLDADATNTVTFLAHSNTNIHDGVRTALFSGSSYGTKSSQLQDDATSGATPLLVMPCQGTNGKTIERSTSHSDLGGQNAANGLRTSEQSSVKGKVADAFERAAVTRVNLAGGVRISGVVGRAHVTRDARGYSTDVKGSSTGRIVFNGERVRIPASGVLRIRGVAKIESNLVKRSKHGIEITALRVSLLDGSAAVINIGHAKVMIRPSGL